jgi:squalene-associated FAD-dependent desaturase
MTRALVLGGGVAGLLAAFLLRERGHAVTLLESRGWLGGRAFSFADRSGQLDNGPHVMLGCYRAMRGLLRRLGSESDFLAPPSLALAYRLPGGRTAQLRLWRGLVPLALPPALSALPFERFGRLRALRGMLAALRTPPAEWSLERWLLAHSQHGGPRDLLWLPMCRAMMNAEPEAVSAALFVATMREALGGRSANAAIWIPRKPWSDILDERARHALPAAGIELRLGARVTGLERTGGRVDAVMLGNGERIGMQAGDLVVSALPWHALARLLPADALPAAALQGSPIVTAWFAQADGAPPLPDDGPLVALVRGEPFHFLFRTPGGDPRRFALLSGGSRAFDGMQVAAIERTAREQLARYFPGFPADFAAGVRISKEANATFVGAPGAAALRPAPGRLPNGPTNLLVCGDWTACGLPSTLEGAARSAEQLVAAS